MRVDKTLSLESTFSESVQTFCCVSVTPDILQKTELKRRSHYHYSPKRIKLKSGKKGQKYWMLQNFSALV